MSDVAPPRVLRLLLESMLPVQVRDGLVGDLEELYAEHVERRGRTRAYAWYARQFVSAAFHYGFRRSPPSPTHSKKATTMLDSLTRDVGYALRNLRRAPGFAAVIVLTLALGIGANTAIWTLLDAVALRPLPVPEPDQLVQVTLSDSPGGGA